MSSIPAASPEIAQNSQTCLQQAVEVTKEGMYAAYEGAVQVGQWISNQTVHVVAWFKEAFGWIGQGIVELATTIKEGALALFSFLCDTAVKAYKFIVPHISNAYNYVHANVTEAYQFVVDFVKAHPNETAVGAIALVAGAVTALVLERICCCCC